ncbi:hypothetical protein WA026_016805 [Henosepilachna vigintioctopunctata]|uniref:CCR4-NOT transcription complex subunit 4 n=1 Tax=Henosepilachna vigintioctopunctata TaxID=420089 RepID=A0AAW1V371_9CUCU
MSVLNQSGEEQVECPLCMEPLEVDDLNFYPCTCGYQICRFCWHRIRTDENGLCPACRKAYSEDPADFIPLSKEQVAKLKADKRHRDQQRKAKLSENRKHLASVRVVQRNLVFVVGLPVRLADPELLKKHEYFGKFGKIHKVVINQSTSYAGSQGPSASAYVTYMKSDDALRAIESVNNIVIDGRLLKSSLGTTKYCSHFMKNQPCPKADCMYLHDFGDPEASFTKEQMHAGKHQEYEKKLHEALLTRQNTTPPPNNVPNSVVEKVPGNTTTPPASQQNESGPKKDFNTSGGTSNAPTGSSKSKEGSPSTNSSSANKDNWPQLNTEKSDKPDVKRTDNSKEKSKSNKSKLKNSHSPISNLQNIDNSTENASNSSGIFSDNSMKLDDKANDREHCDIDNQLRRKLEIEHLQNGVIDQYSQQIQRDNLEKFKNRIEGQSIFALGDSKLGLSSDNTSFFSQGFQTVNHAINGSPTSRQEASRMEDNSIRENGSVTPTAVLTDAFPSINTSEDWAAAFGFANHSDHLEELAKQTARGRQDCISSKDQIETNGIGVSSGVVGGFHQSGTTQAGTVGVLSGFSDSKLMDSGFDSPRRYYENSKLQEGILDTLVTNKTNGFGGVHHFGGQVNKEPINSGMNGINGLDQNMSKFFMDFHKNHTQLSMLNGIHSLLTPPQSQNGFYPQQSAVQERLLLLQQQKQLEEQLMNLNLKHQQQQQSYQFQNGLLNRDLNSTHSPFAVRQMYMPNPNQCQATGLQQSALSSAVQGNQGKMRQLAEDELDFDPFQETQKALAELIATEKNHPQGRSNMVQGVGMNGLVHNQSNNSVTHLPPPPPGFIQQNSTHMNSFARKRTLNM